MGNCLSTCAKSSDTASVCQTQDGGGTNPACPSSAVQVVGEDKVRELVQQELQALQDQISHSQAVLAKLHFRFTDDIVSEPKSDLAKVHRTTQTSNPDNLPKSLECVALGVDKSWQQITSSCPAIVNTAVQTDDETTSKSNGTSGEYFLPPISPLGSQVSEPESPRDGDDVPSKPLEPRSLGHMDLDIYRSCRKLSVLPEEEMVPDEISPPSAGCRLTAAPHYPHQAHSFESYLLPVSSPSVRRQLSDPTPSPDIHPASRRSSRSTSRPLQLQPEIFRFPDVKPTSPQKEPVAQKSPPCVKFQNPLENISEDLPRITSPTYNILQDTVSQLITMSNEYLDTEPEGVNVNKKDSLTIPGYYAFTPEGSTPFKTPPETSLMSTPGFFTPQDISEKRLPDSLASSCFHTPSSISPVTNPESSKSTSSNGNSAPFKTPPADASGGTSYQSSYSSPLYMSPLAAKRAISKYNENNFTEVPDLKNLRTNSKLYVKPLQSTFDPNRTMLSILFDEPRVQKDNMNTEAEESTLPFISFTSLEIQSQAPEVPSFSVSSTEASLSPTSEGLARTPSRRRLQRSLVRISSETPLELVPVEASVTSPTADVPASSASPAQEIVNHDTVEAVDPPAGNEATKPVEVGDGPKMRRTNSDGGGGGLASVCALTASNSFPSLSDTVLRQLGALMEEVKQNKEENQSSEKDIESKFTSLMLAFKTDKLTLERRTELQRRLRDQAEQNMAAELAKLKLAIQMLSPLCTDSEKFELLEQVSEQADALHKSTTRVSTSAEMFGAVQQENRLSKAVDIVLRHVENLKQAYEKERIEHEETRKVLTDNKIPSNAVLKLESRSVSRARLGSLPRKLSNTILEAEPEETSTKDTSATTNSGGSQLRGEMGEGGNTSARTLQRKPSRQAIIEERRQSSSQTATVAESESEDEGLSMEPTSDNEAPSTIESNPTIVVNRRVSTQVPWTSAVADWVRPGDQMLVQLRYSVAIALLVAALAIFTSTFIPLIS